MTKIISDYPEARSLLRRIAEYQQQISTYDYLSDEYLSQYGRDRATLSAADDLGAYAPGNYLTMLNDRTLECYFAIADILQIVNDIHDVEASAVLVYIYHRRYSLEQVGNILSAGPENVAALHDCGLHRFLNTLLSGWQYNEPAVAYTSYFPNPPFMDDLPLLHRSFARQLRRLHQR